MVFQETKKFLFYNFLEGVINFSTLYGKFGLCVPENVCKMPYSSCPEKCAGIMSFPHTLVCGNINSCILSFAHIFRCARCGLLVQCCKIVYFVSRAERRIFNARANRDDGRDDMRNLGPCRDSHAR